MTKVKIYFLLFLENFLHRSRFFTSFKLQGVHNIILLLQQFILNTLYDIGTTTLKFTKFITTKIIYVFTNIHFKYLFDWKFTFQISSIVYVKANFGPFSNYLKVFVQILLSNVKMIKFRACLNMTPIRLLRSVHFIIWCRKFMWIKICLNLSQMKIKNH